MLLSRIAKNGFPPDIVYGQLVFICHQQSQRLQSGNSLLINITMNRSYALELLSQCKPELAMRYGVIDIALFGSTARNTARENSDLDVLVTFDGPATSARYFGVQFYLEDIFGCPVDLVTDKALRSELRPFIEKEAVHV